MPPDDAEPLTPDEEYRLRQLALLLAGGAGLANEAAAADLLREWLGPAARRPEDYADDPNHVDAEGWTPLLHTCAAGDVNAARLLLDAGADPAYLSPDGSDSPLTAAADAGSAELVELLLSRGAPLEREGKPHHALRVLSGLLPVPDKSLFQRLFLTSSSARGDGASGLLSTAAQTGDRALLEWLLDHGATMPRPAYDLTLWLIQQDRNTKAEELFRSLAARLTSWDGDNQ